MKSGPQRAVPPCLCGQLLFGRSGRMSRYQPIYSLFYGQLLWTVNFLQSLVIDVKSGVHYHDELPNLILLVS